MHQQGRKPLAKVFNNLFSEIFKGNALVSLELAAEGQVIGTFLLPVDSLRPVIQQREELGEEDSEGFGFCFGAAVHHWHDVLQNSAQHVQDIEVRHFQGAQEFKEVERVECVFG